MGRQGSWPASRSALLGACLLAVGLTACGSTGTAPPKGSADRTAPGELLKSDIDRVVETHQRAIFASLRRLSEKLYRRNPRELRKAPQPELAKAVARIYENPHAWRLAELDNRRDIDALQLAFRPEFAGDRVAAFSVGMASMVQTAFGDRTEFFLLDSLEAQPLYNAARNVELAAWKLANSRGADGQLLLLSNQMGEVNNLSFEREMGRIIGHLDVLSEIASEKNPRTVVRVVQTVASTVFLPVRPSGP